MGASKPNWVTDEDEQFKQRVLSYYASTIGTLLHDISRKYIKHSRKIHKYDKPSVELDLLDADIPEKIMDMIDFDTMFITMMAYINDAVGFCMKPEKVLYYSDNCFGTADSIGFYEKQKTLRIHDLKTGKTPAKIEQLLVYAALFCLEYKVKPEELNEIELRIYQLGDCLVHKPSAEEVRYFMNRIQQRDLDLDEFLGREVA